MSANPSTGTLNPDSILIEEFKYIAQSAFQNSEDRARVSSFYLVTVGSIIVAILGTRIDNVNPALVNLGLSLLFILLSIVGAFTLIQLIQLRRAWLDAVAAMNAIKQHYMDAFPQIGPAIKWMNVPPGFKGKSMSTMLALQVGAISALTLGTAVYFLLKAGGAVQIGTAVVFGAIYFMVLEVFYIDRMHRLDKDRNPNNRVPAHS